MTRATNDDNAPHELLAGLMEALLATSLVESAPDRLMLYELVRRNVPNVPEIDDDNAKQFSLATLIMHSLSQPGGARALRAVLAVIGPGVAGVRRACHLLDSASLVTLLSAERMQQGRSLLRQADARGGVRPGDVLRGTQAPPENQEGELAEVFDLLAARPPDEDGSPPALTFVSRVAARLDDEVGDDLNDWVVDQARWLGVPAESLVRALFRDAEPNRTSRVDGSGALPETGRRRTAALGRRVERLQDRLASFEHAMVDLHADLGGLCERLAALADGTAEGLRKGLIQVERDARIIGERAKRLVAQTSDEDEAAG